MCKNLESIYCCTPCYPATEERLLFKISEDAEGIVEVKCPKRRKCIVQYDATTKDLKCQPTR